MLGGTRGKILQQIKPLILILNWLFKRKKKERNLFKREKERRKLALFSG